MIHVPHYRNGSFKDLAEAVESLGRSLEYYIPKLVLYNVCYRDMFHDNGFESLKQHLLTEAPRLANDSMAMKALEKLRDFKIAPFDIQCLPCDSVLSFFGIEANGFRALKQAVGIRTQYWHTNNPYLLKSAFRPSIHREKPEKPIKGLYIAEIYERYPCFDSDDYANENRYFQNFFISRTPFSDDRIMEYMKNKATTNVCMVRDDLSLQSLPAVYYVGEGNYMLAANEKHQY